jgi:hypothetical protein
LFPGEVELPIIISQVEQLAQLFSDIAAERYALTLRLMLANLRRKLGLGTSAPSPTALGDLLAHHHQGQGQGQNQGLLGANASNTGVGDGTVFPTNENFMGMEEFGFTWPADNGTFNPNSIPLWLQEASLTDLGLPINGSDGIFLNTTGPGWSMDIGGPLPETW